MLINMSKPGTRAIRFTALRIIGLAILAPLVFGAGFSAMSDDSLARRLPPGTKIICLDGSKDCTTKLIRLPDGLPGQVLKFEFCQEGDCDRAHREHWRTHYLVPPPGEVCLNTNVNEALHWIEDNARGWLLAGWGCVSHKQLPV